METEILSAMQPQEHFSATMSVTMVQMHQLVVAIRAQLDSKTAVELQETSSHAKETIVLEAVALLQLLQFRSLKDHLTLANVNKRPTADIALHYLA
jgi:hypothetical protein